MTKQQTNNLIQTMTEYIKLLENECSRMSVFCHTHGINAKQEDIQQGIKLRAKIKELKDENIPTI